MRFAEGQESWLYDAVENGALEAIRLGKQLRFRPSALIRYLDEREQAMGTEIMWRIDDGCPGGPGRVCGDVRRGDGQVLIAMRNQHPTDMGRFLMGRADH